MDVLPAGVDTWPVHAADAELLADLELLLGGARLDLGGQLRPLPDGQVALRAQPDVADKVAEAGHVVLADPEGAPLAVLARVPTPIPRPPTASWVGPLTPLRAPAYGPFRGLQRGTGRGRRACAPRAGPSPAWSATGRCCAPTSTGSARPRTGTTCCSSPVRPGRQAGGLPPEALVRAVRAAARTLGNATVVTAPLRRLDPARDAEAAAELAAAYGVTDLLRRSTTQPGGTPWPGWTPRTRCRTSSPRRRYGPSCAAGARHGHSAAWSCSSPACPARASRRWPAPWSTRCSRTAAARSPCSTATWCAASCRRGLGFSQADRDLNVRRIGWVAAEVARHGGLAVCAPIAPYAATRAAVRAEAEAVGDFFLVHVATPLEVCEQRDRKGLYAKARAGLIPHFTGISDPYEEPDDAELVVDTSTEPLDQALDRLLAALRDGGWI